MREKKDDFGRMLAFGIGSMIGLQALINIAVATVSVPTKGLSLPLVSAGGSGLVITCGALGLMLSACRFTHHEAEPQSSSPPRKLAREHAARPLRVVTAARMAPIHNDKQQTNARMRCRPSSLPPLVSSSYSSVFICGDHSSPLSPRGIRRR